MIDLKQSVQYVKGVGPTRASLLNKLGIYTLEDLITFFPRTYEDRSKAKNIAELMDKEEALIDVVVVNNHYSTIPIVGVIDHYLDNGKLAICYNYYKCTVKIMAYRHPSTVIKLKSINKNVINHIFNK